MDTTETYCARHKDTPTRLSCTQCGTAICPRCAVDAPVGQKCPSCAKHNPSAIRRGKPDQYRNGVALGLAAALGVALVLPLALGIPFLGLIATGFGGFGIGTAVLRGAQGNRAETFRRLSMGLAVLAVAASFLFYAQERSLSAVIPGGLRGVLVYAAAVYGAYTRFDR